MEKNWIQKRWTSFNRQRFFILLFSFFLVLWTKSCRKSRKLCLFYGKTFINLTWLGSKIIWWGCTILFKSWGILFFFFFEKFSQKINCPFWSACLNMSPVFSNREEIHVSFALFFLSGNCYRFPTKKNPFFGGEGPMPLYAIGAPGPVC